MRALLKRLGLFRIDGILGRHSLVVFRICDAILTFNVLLLEGHLELNCHFAFLNVL
jgi:hypothetical protein